MTVQLQLGTVTATLDAQRPRLLIGRDPSCAIVVGDPSLSRRHAEIFLDGGRTWLRDLGSSNGTWVNGQLVGAQPVALAPGQQVYLGLIPLGVAWPQAGGGATMMAAMPAELLALVEQRKRALAAGGVAAPGAPPVAATPPQLASFAEVAPFAPTLSQQPGLGVGGKAAPLPSTLSYRRQGANGNGTLLIALPADTFTNNQTLDGYVEFTATDDETVVSIFVDLVEVHRKGPSGGHVWDRMLVRQGPWRAKKGDVLPLPFSLRIPPGTSISGRDVYWEIRGTVDINWAVDIEAQCPITMRNTDIERVRDALGSLDYRIRDLDSIPMGQRFTGTFDPPAHLRSQLGVENINLAVEYLGANLKVTMEVEKTSLFKFDKRQETVFELARFRGAPLAEVAANFKQQIDQMMAK